MAKKDVPDPGRRTLLEAIARDIGGFVRELRRELNAPSTPEQESTTELEELKALVQEIAEQSQLDHQRLEELTEHTEYLVERAKREDRKQLLRQIKDIVIGGLLLGTAEAVRDALVEDKLYQERLKPLLDSLPSPEPAELAPSAAAEPTPTPTEPAPTSTPEPTPEPVEAPKPRPGTWLEPELILIPAGRFMMGSDKSQDPGAYDNELPQHQVYVGNFYIAKYPVTNAEYRRFVDTTGHRKPYHWESEDLKSFRGADQPVVDVTWRDANAYCNWLSGMTGKSYRLPTEAEWEKAARGTDGRIYPWGNLWDAKRCNCRESGPGHTTPVGRYSPRGDSPYGCVDMAGNVWEWTSSVYKSYPYDPGDGRENLKAGDDIHRVLRGGAFASGRDVRCACRLWNLPDLRLRHRGFRLCVAPGFL
jgi:formylglycine-generating enzyme required for sulfatase activity